MATLQSIIARAVISNLNKSIDEIKLSTLNLSSGIKNNANVADFAVGTTLKAQTEALKTATLNAAQGKSLAETAKGTLDQIIELVQEQQSLAEQATDSSLTDNERAQLNIEFQALTDEIDRLASTTKFNNRTLLDGTVSGTAEVTTTTGQDTENYSLLATSNYSLSGTTASATQGLKTSSVFSAVAAGSVGTTAGVATLNFSSVTGTATNAVIKVGGDSVTFTASGAGATAAATAFVTAAKASTSNNVRKFIYTDNLDGTVTVTTADKGTGANSTTFQLTNDGGAINTNGLTFGGDSIDTTAGATGSAESLSTSTPTTAAANRTLSASDITIDSYLEGGFSNFTGSLDTSGTQNSVVFTVDINGVTYTSQAVTLFGTSGFNSKGHTIRNGQVIVFENTDGPTNGSGVLTDNAFSLTVGSTDISISDTGSQSSFEANLTTLANTFNTQLADNSINQSRDITLTTTSGTDFSIAAADGTVLEGLQGFDNTTGANVKGDIQLVSDNFGDDGTHGRIGTFSFNAATNKISTTIDGQTFTADLTGTGIVDGAGGYNDTTQVITVGAGTILVFESADSTTDGRQLRIDLSNLDATEINLGTSTSSKAFTDALNTVFDVSNHTALTFQVGQDSSNYVTVAIDPATTRALYLDDSGTSKTLDISTLAGATAATDILDNALNNALTISSGVNSNISTFESIITSNDTITEFLDSASSSLLNTDYALESTLLAEATVKAAGAISVLANEQTRLQSILTLLKQ